MRWITVACVLLTVLLYCDANVDGIESLSVHPLVTPMTTGTAFVFAFLSSHFNANVTENLWVLVSNQNSTATVQVTITSNYPGFQAITATVGPQNVTRIPILPVDLQSQYPNNLTGSVTTIEKKGLRLISTLPVTVYLDNERTHGGSGDGMLVLPICQLGTNYETINEESDYATINMYSVVALQDNTEVRWINGSVGGTPTWGVATLNALEVLTNSHTTRRLTATEVKASAPVAVISGNVCGVSVNNNPVCDFESVMLTPQQAWGTKFFFVTFEGTTLNGFILTVNQTTNVYRDSTLLITITADQYLIFNTGTSYIWTDKPAEVVQEGRLKVGTVQTGAPFFVHSPPSEQFITGPVQFATDALLANNTEHYVRIVTTVMNVGTFAIDNYTPSALLYTRVGRSSFYFYNMRIMPGTHTITPASPSNFYSAVVYGYGDSTGYGFAAGLNLPAVNGPCAPTK
uniref:IgGFc-binding protein N-terminal domain-containing protein n=1 Tax=Plectus sambesii TaxID=2011161 RepID=A0A914X1Z5_9BILA